MLSGGYSQPVVTSVGQNTVYVHFMYMYFMYTVIFIHICYIPCFYSSVINPFIMFNPSVDQSMYPPCPHVSVYMYFHIIMLPCL